jgi:hypothetical protein
MDTSNTKYLFEVCYDKFVDPKTMDTSNTKYLFEVCYDKFISAYWPDKSRARDVCPILLLQ